MSLPVGDTEEPSLLYTTTVFQPFQASAFQTYNLSIKGTFWFYSPTSMQQTSLAMDNSTCG